MGPVYLPGKDEETYRQYIEEAMQIREELRQIPLFLLTLEENLLLQEVFSSVGLNEPEKNCTPYNLEKLREIRDRIHNTIY